VNTGEYWAEVSDRHGDMHLRDVQASLDRQARAHSAKTFTPSNGISPIGKAWPNAPTELLIGRDGYHHMVTHNMINIYIECQRLVFIGTRTTMTDIGDRVGVTRETVRKSLQRLAAWGLIALATWRGRGGGMLLMPIEKATNWWALARPWREKLRAAWLRSCARLNANTTTRRSGSSTTTSIDLAFRDAERARRRSERDDRIEAHLVGMRRGANKRVPCPAHEGKDANLSFWRRQDGSLGVKCWSMQCDERAVKDAVEPW
jgi:hypothetical protein